MIAEYANQNAIAPKVILASILYNQAKLISTVIKSVVSGTASGGIQEPGIALGVGTIVENGPLMATIPADAIECMHLVSNSIVDGSIRVPSQVALGREGAAKAMDPKMVIPSGTHACFNKRQ